MPKTNYKECRWLIKTVNRDYGDGSYKDGWGYSMGDLIDYNFKINHKSVPKDPAYSAGRKKKEAFRRSIINRRVNIYNEFGLAILKESTPGKIKKKGLGAHYYYLANPELLKEKEKTLEEVIDFLADSETERDTWVKAEEMASDFKKKQGLSMGFITAGGTSSYGFLSTEGTSYRKILGEENLEIMQFAMQFGEVLTIKYGKIRTGVDINAPYSFEPYQLKEIEGRWYVIGNLYPLGHKELAEIAVYDLARLEFADDENPDVLFEPVKGFDINERIVIEYGIHMKLMGKIYSLEVTAQTEEFAKYLSEHPLCSAQEALPDDYPIRSALDAHSYKKFKIFINYSVDLIVQLGAYGEEFSFEVKPKEYRKDGFGYVCAEMIQSQLNYFRKTDE